MGKSRSPRPTDPAVQAGSKHHRTVCTVRRTRRTTCSAIHRVSSICNLCKPSRDLSTKALSIVRDTTISGKRLVAGNPRLPSILRVSFDFPLTCVSHVFPNRVREQKLTIFRVHRRGTTKVEHYICSREKVMIDETASSNVSSR